MTTYAKLATTIAVALAILAGGAAQAGQGGTLEVTVNYTGPGEVDAGHAVFLALYPTPAIEPGSVLAAQLATANGATVVFQNVGAATVYLSGLYDEQGGWTGTTTVPSGSPAAAYVSPGSFVPAPIEVAEGATVQVEFTFDDAFRVP